MARLPWYMKIDPEIRHDPEQNCVWITVRIHRLMMGWVFVVGAWVDFREWLRCRFKRAN